MPKAESKGKGPVLHLIRMTTRSFEFEAVGTTEKEARDILVAGWKKHCSQMKSGAPMTPATWKALSEEYQVYEAKLSAGSFYRDREEVSLE